MRNERRFKNLLVSPKRQARVALLISAFGILIYLIAVSAIISSLFSNLAHQTQDFQIGSEFYYQVRSLIQNSLFALIGLGVVLIIFLVIGTILLTHRFYGPLVQVRKFAAKIQEGDYSTRISIRDSDELHEIVAELNEMAKALEQRHVFGNQKGFSLVEIMVAVGLMTLLMLAATTFFTQQIKSNNFLEFQAKKEQLRLALIGQVLNDANNCKCLFNGAAQFPSAGTAELTGFTQPTSLGSFYPADCSGGIPSPLVNETGIDGLKLASVNIKNIAKSGTVYKGDFTVALDTTKEVIGPSRVNLRIPVMVNTSVSGGSIQFEGCSITGTAVAGTGGIFPNWPDTLNCGGTIYTISREGVYHCYGGGETSTRSSILFFNSSTRKMSNINNQTDNSKCLCGACCTDTIEELIANGLAR